MPYPYSLDEEAQKKEAEYKVRKLKTNRNLWLFMLLNILTLGIYSILFFIPFSFDLDKIDPRADRSKTMNYLFAYILAFFTFFIILYIWHYQIAERVEDALNKRHISYTFGTNVFWGWFVLGSLILIGPFVYFHKLFKAMNLLSADYNDKIVN